MFKQSVEYRWYNAYQAYNRAQNPKFKAFWFKVMQYLQEDLN